MTEIAAENNSTTIFPLPIDLIRPFMEMADLKIASMKGAAAGGTPKLPSPDLLAGLPRIEAGAKKETS